MLQVFAYVVAFVALGTAVRGELELLQLGRSSRNPVVGSQGIGQTTVEHVLAEEVLGELRELRLSLVSLHASQKARERSLTAKPLVGNS